MKNRLILLVTAISFVFTVSAQNNLVEKTFVDLGKILDFKSTLITVKDTKTNKEEKKISFESKSFTSSDAKYVELSKGEVESLIQAITTFNADYFSKSRTSAVEINFSTSKGFEIGAVYELIVEKASATPATKKEKYYIETKEKYYEGKIVNTDQSGTFIWKEVQASTAKEPSGKWTPYVRFVNQSSKYSSNITVDELTNFSKFLGEVITKL